MLDVKLLGILEWSLLNLSNPGWPLVGNEGMKPYMFMMGMKLPSFPTKGQPVIAT